MRKKRPTYADVAAKEASRGLWDDAAGALDVDRFAARIGELVRTGQADLLYPGPTDFPGAEFEPGSSATRYLTPQEQAELRALEERLYCTPAGIRDDPVAQDRYRELKSASLQT